MPRPMPGQAVCVIVWPRHHDIISADMTAEHTNQQATQDMTAQCTLIHKQNILGRVGEQLRHLGAASRLRRNASAQVASTTTCVEALMSLGMHACLGGFRHPRRLRIRIRGLRMRQLRQALRDPPGQRPVQLRRSLQLCFTHDSSAVLHTRVA